MSVCVCVCVCVCVTMDEKTNFVMLSQRSFSLYLFISPK